MGYNINLRQIYRRYAKQMGVSVSRLTERDKKQAVSEYLSMLVDVLEMNAYDEETESRRRVAKRKKRKQKGGSDGRLL